jgi:hypothetical protein
MAEGGKTAPFAGFEVYPGDRYQAQGATGRLWEVDGASGFGWVLHAIGGPTPGRRSDGRPIARPRRIWRGTEELADEKKWRRVVRAGPDEEF